jgi:hypothetical protein
MGDEGGVGGVGGRISLLHLLHEKHAPSPEEGGQGVRHGDDGGGRGDPRTEAAEGVEDEGVGRDGRVIVGERVHELLLTVAVLSDGGGALDQLKEVIVEVDGFVGLVGGEELVDGEPQLAPSLVTREDHVGDILVDGGVEKIEDGVVLDSPSIIGQCGGDSTINVADETRPTEGGLPVDGPLGVVGGVEREDDRGDMAGSAAGS